MLASGSTRPPTKVDELISPRLCATLDQLDIKSARVFAGKLQGERHSKARGRSVEFEDYRQYVAGDDLRHIDWNVFARLDRFFIKVFLEEQDLAVHIAIDASASMDAGNPNKLIQAQRLAMALAYIGLVNNNRVVVWAFDERGVRYLPPVRGRTSVQRVGQFILGEVFDTEAAPGRAANREEGKGAAATFTAAMRKISQTRTGSGVFVLLSDLLIPEGFQQGLSLLAGTPGWDTILLQVLSPGELDPSMELDVSGNRAVIGDLRLTDVETGKAREVTVNADLLKRYMAKLAQHQDAIGQFATSRGLGHVVVKSDADVGELVVRDLRRNGVVR